MHYSSDEIEAMGEGGEVGCCAGDDMEGDWWQSRVISMGRGISTTEIVRPVRQDQSLGDPFPLEAIIRQTTNDGSHFVGEAFVGATFVGEDGSVYGVDDMGFVNRIKRGVKATGRGIARGSTTVVKHGGKYIGKGAMLATAPARQAAKASAWLAFAPVRFTVNQITSGIVRGAARKGVRLTQKQALMNLYAVMSKSRNPLLRSGVALLKQFGPGTSPKVRLMGDEGFVGAAPAAGVAALNTALIAAKGVLIKAAVAAATGAAVKFTARALGPAGAEPRPDPMSVRLPSEEAPSPEGMSVTPSDPQVDHVLDPEPTDESSGWEAGCCV